MKKFLRRAGCAWLTGFSCLFEDIISPSKWVSGDRTLISGDRNELTGDRTVTSGDRRGITGDRTVTSGDRRFPPRSLVKNPFAF